MHRMIDPITRHGRTGIALVACCLLTLVTACGATPVDTDVPRVAYYVSDNLYTERSEGEFEAADGARLGYVRHLGLKPVKEPIALIYLHGISSHAGWFDGPADLLAGNGFDVFCLDRRGSGINRENRGFPSGYIDGYEVLHADIHAFIEQLKPLYDKVYLVGLSWGGKLALSHALIHPDDCDGLVLITPGLVSLVDLNVFRKIGVGTGTLLAPKSQVAIPIQPEMFTTTPEFLEKIKTDPLRLTSASARFFMQSHRLDGLVAGRMPDNDLPIQLYLAGNDKIIDNEGVVELLRRGKQELDVVEMPDQTHSIQFDAPERLVEAMTPWLRARAADGDD